MVPFFRIVLPAAVVTLGGVLVALKVKQAQNDPLSDYEEFFSEEVM